MVYKRDYSQGKEDARQDLASGELIIKTAGMLASWAGQLNRILQERYGVKLVWAVGCTGSEAEFDYVRGYNEVASWAISSKFGKDILEENINEAMEAYKNGSGDEIKGPEMESPVNRHGIVTCAYCGGTFSVSEGERWDGQTHKACGYKLRLYESDAEGAI